MLWRRTEFIEWVLRRLAGQIFFMLMEADGFISLYGCRPGFVPLPSWFCPEPGCWRHNFERFAYGSSSLMACEYRGNLAPET